ncbi:MAG: secondary thiamine-phosphate synthase enzyme YjbQ [Faecalicoccus sp.]|uniref:secondary thiamine-phosphate synthase enzyme YjbQ n=1 Tax=Faecalicoccus sp. TaxID=1971758 RepID=UPI002A837264|nr:secondary thiamine-phosphate synthase enzyme YjbQ [Faecalicoccus sp.]MDY4279003.1 secondary thiamine-phosphate synthase enzyme YjbQ [Faecalicoccus sp.]
MIKTYKENITTHKEFEMIPITDLVRKRVEESRIQAGIVYVITAHTSSGIIVNENLPCLMTDIEETLERLVPLDHDYAHSHFLLSYGATGGNAPGHLKSMLCGNHTVMVIEKGKIECGQAQDIYFAEFDGPQARTIFIHIQGEQEEK